MNDLRIFVDSDAFVALTVKIDAHYERARSLLHALRAKPVLFFTSNYVFSESITVISMRSSHDIAIQYIETMQALDSPFQIKRAEETLDAEALTIFKAQASKNTSFVDCTNMVFMHQFHLDAIFSFDQVYRTNKLTLVEDLLAREQAA
jgi:predicted nucleic acid-binding protein